MKSESIVVLLRGEDGRGGQGYAAVDDTSGEVFLHDVHWAGDGAPPAWNLALLGCSLYLTVDDWQVLNKSGHLAAVVGKLARREAVCADSVRKLAGEGAAAAHEDGVSSANVA